MPAGKQSRPGHRARLSRVCRSFAAPDSACDATVHRLGLNPQRLALSHRRKLKAIAQSAQFTLGASHQPRGMLPRLDLNNRITNGCGRFRLRRRRVCRQGPPCACWLPVCRQCVSRLPARSVGGDAALDRCAVFHRWGDNPLGLGLTVAAACSGTACGARRHHRHSAAHLPRAPAPGSGALGVPGPVAPTSEKCRLTELVAAQGFRPGSWRRPAPPLLHRHPKRHRPRRARHRGHRRQRSAKTSALPSFAQGALARAEMETISHFVSYSQRIQRRGGVCE